MVIQITTNANQMAVTLKQISSKLRKGYFGSIKQTTKLGEGIAKALAPTNTGRLKQGIHSRVFKNKGEVLSSVPGPFPYHFWVNKTKPFRVLHFRKKNRFFATPQDVIYGNTAISKSHNNIKWTGMPGYLDVTADVMDTKLVRAINNAIAKALRG